MSKKITIEIDEEEVFKLKSLIHHGMWRMQEQVLYMTPNMTIEDYQIKNVENIAKFGLKIMNQLDKDKSPDMLSTRFHIEKDLFNKLLKSRIKDGVKIKYNGGQQ